MTILPRSLVALALVFLCTGCSPKVNCGPLDAASCAKAVQVAERTLETGHPRVQSVEIEAPSAAMPCPPSGGLTESRCDVTATVTTSAGATTVGLVRAEDGGWLWAVLIR